MRRVVQSEKEGILLRERIRFLTFVFLRLDKGFQTCKEIQPVFEDKLAADSNFEIAQVYTLIKPIQVMRIHFRGRPRVSRHEIHIRTFKFLPYFFAKICFPGNIYCYPTHTLTTP